jgi:O-antigen ligase
MVSQIREAVSSPRVFLIIFLLYAFTLPFRINFSNLLLGVLVLSSFFNRNFISNLKNTAKNNSFLLPVAYFFIHIIFLINTTDIRSGWFLIEKELSLLVFPVIVFANHSRLTRDGIDQILTAFIAGLVVTCFTLIGLFTYLQIQRPGLTLENFFREEAYHYIQLHPSYFAMYLAFAIFILAFKIQDQKSVRDKLILGTIIFFLMIFIPLSGARTSLGAFIILSCLLLFMKVEKPVFRWIVLTGFVIGLPVLAFLSLKIPVISKRFDEIRETKFEPPLGIHFNSTNLRIAQLLCSKEILTDNWFLGVGTGDAQKELNECYKGHGWSPALYERSYNTHNQFIQTWITLGIPGLLLLLLILANLIALAIRRNDYLLLSFVILFALCSMTESMFEKNKGVIFFACFSVLLTLRCQLDSEEKKLVD